VTGALLVALAAVGIPAASYGACSLADRRIDLARLVGWGEWVRRPR
jgi:hypothetical protein